jgi:hypothetical protein
MVLLDVVYNHFGPEGNYLRASAPQFFTGRHHTPWGDGINFDGAESRTVRDFFIHNALYWLNEYCFDGLRLDAVHAIADDSVPHILTELAEVIRANCTPGRHIHLVLENDETNLAILSAQSLAYLAHTPLSGMTTFITQCTSRSLESETDITWITRTGRSIIWLVASRKALPTRENLPFSEKGPFVVNSRPVCRRQLLFRSFKITIKSGIAHSETAWLRSPTIAH